MNLPNKLTMLRMVLIPFFVAFMLLDGAVPFNRVIALVIFVAASLTDYLDGSIARSRGLVTDFGKLMDPLADKLLVMSAMLLMVELMDLSAVVVIIILSREFLVTSLRLVAAPSGKVIAASKWGKAKTVSQMIWIVLTLAIYAGLLPLEAGTAAWVVNGLTVVATALTLISGVDYLWKNRQFLSDR